MGRRKVEIKRIENKSSRQVTFSKRRNGLIEKARQLSILCESSVAVLVVSASGKLCNSSSGDNMSEIINHYEMQHTYELEALDLADQTQNYIPQKESKLEEPNVDNKELLMEFVNNLQEKERLLREENKVLASQIGKTSLVTEDERAPENSSSCKIPEILPLLK